MAGWNYKRYSVYRDDDTPIIIYGTAKECAEALGVSQNTFRCYRTRSSQGKKYPKKITIYEDEVEDEEDGHPED